jgi:hypothetical protein
MSLTSYQTAPPCNKGRGNVRSRLLRVNGFLRKSQFALARLAGALCFGPLCQSNHQIRKQSYDRKAAHRSTCVFEAIT